mmetsp:Transcript_12580/g.18692  ORF Transcript_12580/g.18692 Transcript_12580/m.18692 type:complete len:648 (-) Transcript_12580:92-2035(-)
MMVHRSVYALFIIANLIRCSDAFTSPPQTTHTRSCGVSTILHGSSSDDNNNNEDDDSVEIFYDDFGGTIGDVVSTSSSDISSSLSAAALQTNIEQQQEEEELPEFNDTTEQQPKQDSRELISIPLPKSSTDTSKNDLTGALSREFTLGRDLLLSDYAGSLGFDQVTDWQYYTTDLATGQREDKAANPFDPNQPSRTRSKSGSVVRIFRGEFTGRIGGILRSRGLDTRVLLKEFAVEDDDDVMLLNLASDEQRSLAKIQSSWLQGYCMSATNNAQQMLEQLEGGEWREAAQRRYVDGLTDTPTTKDDEHLATMLECTSKKKAPFTSILGQLNLNDYYDDEDMNPNEWYKSLGVKPPKPGSIWVVYDYHGLSTASSYAVPLIIQQSKLPPKRGMFGNIVQAPPLPPFRERGRYMIRGVLKGMLQSIATAHAADLVHRSIGKNSFILSSVGQDKREATSPYAVVVERLRVVLSDWGFSRDIQEAVLEKEFSGRCRMFGIPSLSSYDYQRASSYEDTIRMEEAAYQFAKAEDLHACGFVFLSMLFTTLADPATLSAPLPATDDDTLQRLFSEIFEKDVDELREYYANEDVWSAVVSLLDMEDRAGWDLLGKLLLSREEVSDWYKNDGGDQDVELTSAEALLGHPFFKMKII